MKKIITGSLLGMALAVPAMAEAGDLNFMHELNTKQRNGGGGGGDKAEWTLFKGTVGITDNIDFFMDVDRDIYMNQRRGSNGSKKDAGWDTLFELRFKTDGFTFNEQKFDFTPTLGLEWDYIEYDGGTADDHTTQENYFISPRFSTTVGGVWLGFDPRFTSDNVNDDTYLELRNQVDFGFEVAGWQFSNWLEFYHYVGADEATGGTAERDGDSYVLDIENYFVVQRPIVNNFHFWMEYGIEAYDTMHSNENSDVSMYIEPRVEYRYDITEEYHLAPYAGYRYTQGDLSNSSDDNWSEVVLGFRANLKM
ncbi:hypothetical protein PM10SUCC1_07620 [Propionigenium maris DSM 9537]|uniref:Porin n=1 Tax=Propionigenium maris DSM 9537 TaxID=1123000 RepID=A0A9W6LM29_9FUSO|nr:hypothetical protein [Propionigenium maris]GLI55247.1 hypothetical protein PM10SUCC1_07620 [Propionigenium maris DSM 9537]